MLIVQEAIPWRALIWQAMLLNAPLLIAGFITACLCGLAGFMMLDRVDRGGAGFALGFFLGPIGLVIAWVMRDNAPREEDRATLRRLHADQIDDIMARLRSTDPNRSPR